MAKSTEAASWVPAIRKADGPVYLAIADALSADILAGILPVGARLPTQRSLAESLGIDFTTVTRAYSEAQRRGLVEGRVGLGTYVRAKPPGAVPKTSAGLVDMSMNLPPHFDDPALVARMWSGVAGLESGGGLDLLLRYQQAGGSALDRAAGARWLADRIPDLSPDRVLVCPGAQGALLALVELLAARDEVICAEALTYPGFRSLAAHLGLRLVAVEMDAEGIVPAAFDAACRRHKPKALYCTPTLHNPTTATMSLERREAIIAVARHHGVPIVEDDAYGMLARRAPPPLAALAPDVVYHIAGLAKCLSPALRIAYVVPPDSRAAARLGGAVRAMTSMASPLTAAIATRWMSDGTADAVVAAIREETAARQEIARALLPPGLVQANPEGFHLWLKLNPPWTRGELISRLRTNGIGVVGSDVFALDSPPEAVRLSLGVPESRAALRQSLHTIADLLQEQPAMSSMVV